MSSDVGIQGSSSLTNALALQAEKLAKHGMGKENAKIDKSSKDFESMLLTSWLQQAYESFGSFPGEEDGEDLGSGKDQFQAIAMQALGSAMTQAGGVGIAKMIAQRLYRNEASQESSTQPDAKGSVSAQGSGNPAISTKLSAGPSEINHANGR